jgi:deoxycytidylate deaminase
MLKVVNGPEVVIGLVGAVGAQLDDIFERLQKHLEAIGYESDHIKVIELLEEMQLPRYSGAFGSDHKGNSYHWKMNAGNDLRRVLTSSDALAKLAIRRIRETRTAWNLSMKRPVEQPIPSRAYVLNSLKRPEEVNLLRDVYGDSFHLISAYATRDRRKQELEKRIGDSKIKASEDPEAIAEELIRRDLREKDEEYGQKVRDTFPEADFFVDATTGKGIDQPIDRFVQLLFGNEFLSPSKDELGMFIAFGARLRSADLARQVGASIMSKRGDIIAIGANDVPRSGGGQYWADDELTNPEDDGRDFVSGRDESNVRRRKIFSDTVDLLQERGIIDLSTAEKLNGAEAFAALRDGKLMAVTEYGRSVHAEMAAITDSARRGSAIAASVLYTSTFPCHNCAKHIVAAGVERVVYVHPYPKSEVAAMYKDSISIDADSPSRRVNFQTFVGIAPRRYEDFFVMKQKRKDDGGKVLKWGVHPKTVVLRMETSPLLYLRNEGVAVDDLEALLVSQNLRLNTNVEPWKLGVKEES